MKISEMSRGQKLNYLESAYDAAVAAHSRGDLEGPHPSRTLVKWAALGDNSASDDVPPGGGEIDDQEIRGNASSPVSPAAANRSGGKTAIDGHYQLGMDSTPRFFKPDGTVVVGHKALELRALQNGDVSEMHRLIPGYGRIG